MGPYGHINKYDMAKKTLDQIIFHWWIPWVFRMITWEAKWTATQSDQSFKKFSAGRNVGTLATHSTPIKDFDQTAHICAVWSESLMGALANLNLMLYPCSNVQSIAASRFDHRTWHKVSLRDRGAAGQASQASLRCGPWARHFYPS